MMKKVSIALFLILIFLPLPVFAADKSQDDVDKVLTQDFNAGVDQSLDSLDMKGMEKYFEEQKDALQSITQGKDLKEFIRDMATGKISANYKSIFQYILSIFFDGVKKSVPYIIQILIIALLFSVLSGFTPTFGESGVSKMAFYAQFILIGGISITIFSQIFTEGIRLVNNISGFCSDFFPVLFFLLTALGGITSVNLLKPTAAALTGAISMFVKTLIMPMLIMYCIFVVINSISSQIKFSGFISLTKSIIKWALGIAFIVFLGVVALQGLLGAGFDGISIKAAKYTIDKIVPIIGGMFSDTVDMLIACSLLIKNAVGVAGILILAGMILVPVFNLLAQYFLFKFAGAVIEPMGDGNIASFLKGISDVIMHLIVIILTTGAMFLISAALITGAGDMNVMLR
jgi:stage III sporulation protein AE